MYTSIKKNKTKLKQVSAMLPSTTCASLTMQVNHKNFIFKFLSHETSVFSYFQLQCKFVAPKSYVNKVFYTSGDEKELNKVIWSLPVVTVG